MPINYLKQIQLEEFNENGYRLSPPKEIESIVEGFYIFSPAPKHGKQLIFNDGFPVLVFLQNKEDAITVIAENETFEIKSAWASFGSIKNIYIKYNQNTEQVFITRFYPGAFSRLFDVSPQYFRRKPILSFAELATRNHFSIEDFFDCSANDKKVAFVASYVKKFITKIETQETLLKTLNHIHITKGQGSVRKLTNDLGVNYKWLERSFVKNIGLLPKEYIQLQRFIHAYLELLGDADVDLMRIALSNGYYDSNHFLKDFKAYTGKTPLAYLKFQQEACC